MPTRASEELLAAPLPDLIQGMGLAVAEANKKMGESDMVYTISDAEIELNVAISVDSRSSFSGAVDFGIQAFSVNASYSRTYGFKEEASSRIKIFMKAVPRKPASGGGGQ